MLGSFGWNLACIIVELGDQVRTRNLSFTSPNVAVMVGIHLIKEIPHSCKADHDVR